MLGGAITVDTCNTIRILGEGHQSYVNPETAREVRDAGDMMGVPKGYVIGFFKQAGAGEIARARSAGRAVPTMLMTHATLSTGGGAAAGHKNDCVTAAGAAAGWQELDLVSDLNWLSDEEGAEEREAWGAFRSPRGVELRIFHRSAAELGT